MGPDPMEEEKLPERYVGSKKLEPVPSLNSLARIKETYLGESPSGQKLRSDASQDMGSDSASPRGKGFLGSMGSQSSI